MDCNALTDIFKINGPKQEILLKEMSLPVHCLQLRKLYAKHKGKSTGHLMGKSLSGQCMTGTCYCDQ